MKSGQAFGELAEKARLRPCLLRVGGVPLALLVGYVERPDLDELPVTEHLKVEECDDWYEIMPEDVPVGDSVEDRRMRQDIIKQFYFQWKMRNPNLCKYNLDLKENIYINHTSLIETAGRASLTYLSTLAVLQLDAILKASKPINPKTKNQKGFSIVLRL